MRRQNPAALKIAEQARVVPIEQLLSDAMKHSLLRFSTAGSVDDGKSTLIGRLLHDSKNIYTDHLEAIRKKSLLEDPNRLALALLTDGLRAEREQGITIDVAYRQFSTPKRRFILADSPGHEQYTRNMATGASTADLTIVLVDASKGVLTQTKRHAFIASLMGVPRLLVAINKMDLVNYREAVFEEIRSEFSDFAAKLGIRELRFIPVSALAGDNIVEPSKHMSWFAGETVMQYLENVYIGGDVNLVDFRFPVQYVIRSNEGYRGYAGQVAAGTIRVGEEVLVLPSMRKTKIAGIDACNETLCVEALKEAFAPMSVTITLADHIDVGRGDMLVRPLNIPHVQDRVEAMMVWMNETPMDPTRSYLFRHTTREAKAAIGEVKYKIDVNSLHRTAAGALSLNEIGRVSFRLTQACFFDSYQKNRGIGSFVLIDPETFQTVGAGMVVDRLPALRTSPGESVKERAEGSPNGSAHLHHEQGFITREVREQRFGNRAVTFWFTGLSGSGKSTLAKHLERELFKNSCAVYCLDGDNLRRGLNHDLGFAPDQRSENIRRVAEVARLFNDAGVSVVCSLISPFENDRAAAKRIIGQESFIEIYLSAALEACEDRDPHGLYAKARAGEITEFTGVSSPYEIPRSPDLAIDTTAQGVEECIQAILRFYTRER